MTEWQPIETAPRDGTDILLRGRPIHLPDDLEIPGPVTLTGYWDVIDAAFCVTTASWLGPFMEATHWMPLPTPPRGDTR